MAGGARPAKVYVEPTNACNLACATCVRHAWDEPEGFMAWDVFEAVVEGLAGRESAAAGRTPDAPGTVAFMGLGEPLLHPRFLDMVRLAKERGLRAEVTTNALLLDEAMAAGLLEAGLDQLVVSIDGASAEAFGRVRSGASLERVVENVRRLDDHGGHNYGSSVRIGVEFVAMRSNVAELPGLGRLAARLGATFIIVSNVLAYTPEASRPRRSTTTAAASSTAPRRRPPRGGSCRRSTGTARSARRWARPCCTRAPSASTAPSRRRPAAAVPSSTPAPAPSPGTAA